ncbi:MAG: DUF87 domain-containing protein [Firmicutes bacterium]|nr:DUF87 domain-containing protein [Bacillota bacterium]
MQRLIPGKTKVHIELFRGVTIGDVIVGAIAVAMLIFVLISNLPGRLFFCAGILFLTVLLLVRLDDQPNYVYLLHILSFFGYKRRFARNFSDNVLYDISEKGEHDAYMDQLFGENAEKPLTRAEKKKLKKANKEQALAQLPAPADENADGEEVVLSEKERKRLRKEEDRLLKSKDVSEEEKEAIRARQKARSEASARRMAEYKERTADRETMSEIIAFTGIKDGFIEYLGGQYYGAVLRIDPVEFRFFSEHRRINSIENCFGRVLRSLHSGYAANIVKLEQPVMYDRYLAKEYDKLEALSDSYENGVLNEEELKARVEIQYDRINELTSLNGEHRVVTDYYYLVLFESDKRQLDIQIREAQQLLQNGELTATRLDDKELAIFLKYSNQIDFDERDIEKVRPEEYYLWAQPDVVDIHPRRVEVNHIITHNFRVVAYPTMVGDAWLAGVMSYPATKVVVKAQPMDRAKSIRNIDRSLQELRGQWSATGVDSRRMELETHIETLQELLTTLQNDSESLLEVNVYITAYDIVSTRNNPNLIQPPVSQRSTINELKKNVRRAWQESSFRLNNMEFDQVQAFIGSQVSALDPMAKEGRGISSNAVAACFPWIYANVSDEGGIKLGESEGIPVFIDFFRRDSERVNSNMVIVGKSGSGKSYATKSLLANLAAEDAKIYILDPENEYSELARNLHGQIINVGNAQYGRLNPFQIITALEDDEVGDTGPSGSYATHLQFLEEFFRQIMPDCEKDAMEYLNTLVDHMYMGKDITADTDLSMLRPEDYPIFDDLYDEVLQEFQSSDNPFTRDLLRTLMNYIAKFSSGGRNANIWNGPSTITTEENFTVFNFQSMLANRNQTIANAQMLLVLKYLDNEIIKNRDYNTKYKANRKIVIVIDEAHVFIDAKFPIALDFMFQLAKRIRKYNGMQIVITQNIKDFVGSEELARKSTAIINACQYSFIFSLAPNDIQDLVKLYEKAGGINETEQEQIVQAPRGQAFVVMSPTSRSSFTIDTAPGITQMFEERDYQSRYFTGEQGAVNWENFVGVSREAHEQAMLEGRKALPEADYTVYESHGVTLNVFEEDEYEALQEEKSSGGVSLNILDEEPEELPKTEQDLAMAQVNMLPKAGGAEMAVFSQIADALGRMADAATGVPVVPREVNVSGGLPAREKDAISSELERRLAEKDDEIRRLREEFEQLKAEKEAPKEDIFTVFEEPETEPFDLAEPEEPEASAEGYGEEEEDGELFTLFAFGQEDEDEETIGEDEEEPVWDGSEEAEDTGGEIPADEEELESEEDEDDDDFMSSFCRFAESLQNMTVFERMKANGTQTANITLEELIREAETQTARRREKRSASQE